MRATIGHDSYERLVNVPVALGDAWIAAGLAGTSPITDPLKNPDAVGLSSAVVTKKALEDEGIVEFCRFYVERRKQELSASGGDLRKRKKIEDDFTPRLEAHLVGLEGSVRREIALKSTYALGTGHEYSSAIEVLPSENKITQGPDMLPCSRSETIAPRDCFLRKNVRGLCLRIRNPITQSDQDRGSLSGPFAKLKVIGVGIHVQAGILSHFHSF